ncbi:PKD domain-containing protein [Geothrix alkalitolerans]|uniref:PKD domain-containing protein n=1 Tax=Geothrix alkalitolerans TaxID=2922724 RepID=UPI001FAFCA87|nr:PKD domain-containing protein [Geothrix alkalitolerans]
MPAFRVLLSLALAVALGAQTPKKILFDHTRHEEAGTSAEWVICSASEPDPSPVAPASETDWNGGISAWAFDLYKAGYKVQSLPPAGRVTYGDATNAQDLSSYAVYVIPEPYLLFTAAEKQAILSFVQNGGGLFIVCNHPGAARYSGTGGTDAYTVFNDLVAVNGGNPYGFTFVPGHGPGDTLANTTSTAFATGTSPAEQAIIHGAYGGLGLMDFHSYSYLNFNTAQNPNVQEILHTQISGDTGSFIVTCTVGSGRVVAISDSAPSDDGTTTTTGKSLHNSYTLNSNKAFFLNATAYLAGDAGPTAPTPVVGITSPSANVTLTAGGSVSFQGSATIADGSAMTYSWSFGDGGSASLLGPVSHTYATAGTYTATFTATSNQGKSASASRTITVTPASYTITASAGTGGTITPSGAVTVASGGSQTFTISPSAGYVISSVTVDGVNQGAANSYTFSNVTAAHTIAAAFAASAGSSLKETFDTGTKGAYAVGSVALATGSWTLDDALLGNTTADRKVGAQSVRTRNSGKVTMAFNFATGAKTVSVKHAKYGSDGNSTWGLWYSTNSGSTWIQAGSSVTTTSTTLATASFTVNVAGGIRFQIRKTDGSANRVNFDDFQIAGY